MKPDAEIRAIQERADKLLPSVVPRTANRPVEVLVGRGREAGTAFVQVSYGVREDVREYAPNKVRVSLDVALLKGWTDLAFKDFLDKAVKKLLTSEE